MFNLDFLFLYNPIKCIGAKPTADSHKCGFGEFIDSVIFTNYLYNLYNFIRKTGQYIMSTLYKSSSCLA